jgi:hypothetical protein
LIRQICPEEFISGIYFLRLAAHQPYMAGIVGKFSGKGCCLPENM